MVLLSSNPMEYNLNFFVCDFKDAFYKLPLTKSERI